MRQSGDGAGADKDHDNEDNTRTIHSNTLNPEHKNPGTLKPSNPIPVLPTRTRRRTPRGVQIKPGKGQQNLQCTCHLPSAVWAARSASIIEMLKMFRRHTLTKSGHVGLVFIL